MASAAEQLASSITFSNFQKAAELKIPCLFHTGTSGIGAGQPGGQGIKLDPARPIHLDVVAARFPELPIIAAHFWSWASPTSRSAWSRVRISCVHPRPAELR